MAFPQMQSGLVALQSMRFCDRGIRRFGVATEAERRSSPETPEKIPETKGKFASLTAKKNLTLPLNDTTCH
jgi:hypothetical protein